MFVDVRARLVARTTTHHTPQIKSNMNVGVPTYTPQQTTAPPRVHSRVHVRSYVRTNEYLSFYSKRALLVLTYTCTCTCSYNVKNKREVWVCGPITCLEGIPSIEPLEDLLFVCRVMRGRGDDDIK